MDAIKKSLPKVRSRLFNTTKTRRKDVDGGQKVQDILDIASGHNNTSDNTGDPLAGIPPSNIPLNSGNSNTRSPSNSTPKGLLYFKTLSTLLERMQLEKAAPFTYSDRKPTTKGDDTMTELKISTAFANLAVTEHEVVALSTKRSPDLLEVIVCFHLINNKRLKPISINPLKWLVIRNPRKKDNPLDNPSIIHDLKPFDLEDESDEGIRDYIKKRCYLKSPPTPQHLWLLNKLLFMKDPGVLETDLGEFSLRLLCYIVTACFPKMHRRFEDPILSLHFFLSLELVKYFEFDESKQKNAPDHDRHDLEFVTRFLLEASRQNKLQTSVSKILQQYYLAEAKLAQDKLEDKSAKLKFQLYTADTCNEFHSLLLELLQILRASLKALKDLRANPSPDFVQQFDALLNGVVLVGFGLQTLTRGTALKMHLNTISPLLQRHRHDNLPMPPPTLSNEEEDNNGDEALKAVQPDRMVALETSYMEWLKLMLLYFDAGDVIMKYINGPRFPHRAISIKVLSVPLPDKTLLPWRQLFDNSAVFPKGRADPIFKYLEDVVSSNLSESLTWVNAAQEELIQGNISKTVKSLELLQSSTVPNWKESAKNLLVLLKAKDALEPEPLSLILDSLESLCNTGRIFSFLQDVNKPNYRFKGTLHCEACLASLLQHFKDNQTGSQYEDLRAQLAGHGKVIGVSKRCCPVCNYLLPLLTEGNEEQSQGDKNKPPFVVIGSHSTVSACALPTWLPAPIVDSTVVHFGAQLRGELTDLMNRQMVRTRTKSSGSRRISSDSDVGENGIHGDMHTDGRVFGEATFKRP